jgi:hypothetical protein
LHIDVSCAINDDADVKCGGAPILGYDFYINPDEDINEMCNFIKKCIKKYKRPFLKIETDIREEFPVKNLWGKEQIEECIKKYEII